MLFSGHDMVIRLRYAQQLWLPAQDLNKVKPAKILSQVRQWALPNSLGHLSNLLSLFFSFRQNLLLSTELPDSASLAGQLIQMLLSCSLLSERGHR